ncbi:MAG TPA: 50S ribosomal protein L17 [Candidatus Paceibacterota bacterium]
MRKFHFKRGRRSLFLEKIASNLILRERIETTIARAKEIRPIVERLVTIAKKQNLAGLRRLISKLPKSSAQKLFYEIAPKYKDRKGGYLKIVKTAKTRKRDGAPLATVEFIK